MTRRGSRVSVSRPSTLSARAASDDGIVESLAKQAAERGQLIDFNDERRADADHTADHGTDQHPVIERRACPWLAQIRVVETSPGHEPDWPANLRNRRMLVERSERACEGTLECADPLHQLFAAQD